MMRETCKLHIYHVYDKIKTPNPHLINLLCIWDTPVLSVKNKNTVVLVCTLHVNVMSGRSKHVKRALKQTRERYVGKVKTC